MTQEPEQPAAGHSGSARRPQPGIRRSRFRTGPSWLAPVFAMVAGVLIYAVTLGGTYVFDDVYHLFMDERIESPDRWRWYLTYSYNDGIDNLYRPITSLSLAIQAHLHGRSEEAAWLFHLVNVLLYGVVCAQVVMLTRRLLEIEREESAAGFARGLRDGQLAHPGEATGPGRLSGWFPVALLAGVLFAAHPVHVEAVAALVGRADLLCAIGFLGGLLVVMKPLTPARIAAFLALLVLSIGSKEQGLVLPAVVGVWYLGRWWAGLPLLTGGRHPSFPDSAPAAAGGAPGATLHYQSPGPMTWSQRLGLQGGQGKILFILIALLLSGYIVFRENVINLSFAWPVESLDPTIQPMRDAAGADRWLMPIALAGRYLHLLVWPNVLAIDYGASVIVPPQRVQDPYLWLGFLAIALWTAAVVHAVRARWAAGLLLLGAFTFTYAVISNIPRLIGTVFGERLIFLPSVFLVIYAVLLALRATRPLPRLRPALAGAAMVLVLLGMIRSITYAAQWHERGAFYAYQAQVQPQSVRVWMLLGDHLRQLGQFEEAAEAAARATALEPDYWDSWMLRAQVARDAGELEEALEYAERAVQILTRPYTVFLRDQIDTMIRERDGTLQAPD